MMMIIIIPFLNVIIDAIINIIIVIDIRFWNKQYHCYVSPITITCRLQNQMEIMTIVFIVVSFNANGNNSIPYIP